VSRSSKKGILAEKQQPTQPSQQATGTTAGFQPHLRPILPQPTAPPLARRGQHTLHTVTPPKPLHTSSQSDSRQNKGERTKNNTRTELQTQADLTETRTIQPVTPAVHTRPITQSPFILHEEATETLSGHGILQPLLTTQSPFILYEEATETLNVQNFPQPRLTTTRKSFVDKRQARAPSIQPSISLQRSSTQVQRSPSQETRNQGQRSRPRDESIPYRPSPSSNSSGHISTASLPIIANRSPSRHPSVSSNSSYQDASDNNVDSSSIQTVNEAQNTTNSGTVAAEQELEVNIAEADIEAARDRARIAIEDSYATYLCNCTHNTNAEEESEPLRFFSHLWSTLPNSQDDNPELAKSPPRWKEVYTPDEVKCLSLAKSDEPQDQHPIRTFDIDAFISTAKSLDIHREGFNLSLYPKATKTVVQDTYVRFFERFTLHKCKHLRLGEGIRSSGWSTYIAFPNIPIANAYSSMHLTDDDQRNWVENIILPSLRDILGTSLLQRIPSSFEEIRRKSRIKQTEATTTGEHIQSDIFHLVPEEHLAAFWNQIVYRISTGGSRVAKFLNATLIILHYDCKIRFRAESVVKLQKKFLLNFRHMFNEASLPIDGLHTWVDFAWEWTPQAEQRAITFLRKPGCNRHRFHTFGLNHQQEFPVHMFRDAGGARQKTGWRHPMRVGGLAYMQVYQVNKDMFATTAKEHKLFGSPDFEALPLGQELLDDFFAINGSRRSTATAQSIRYAYAQSKTRAFETLRANRNKNFGIRHECRISIELFLALTERPIAIPPDGEQRHRCYWSIPTRYLNNYIFRDFNRILIGLDYLTSRLLAQPGRPAADRQEQIRNATMGAVFCRWLAALAAGTNPNMHSYLDKAKYETRDGTELIGLDFGASITATGIPWLPQYLFNWEILNFKEEYALSTNFVQNQFRSRFKDWRRQQLLDDTEKFLAKMKDDLTPDMDYIKKVTILGVLYDHCCQVYAKHILEMLRDEFDLSSLTALERQGYHGLSLELITRAYGGVRPAISYPRGTTRNGTGTYGRTLSSYACTWDMRIRCLFDFRLPFKPSWENAIFRRTARRCYQIVLDALGDFMADRWMSRIGICCGRRLNCIPVFEATKLHRTQKASPANSQSVQRARRVGEKQTLWMIAYPNDKGKWTMVQAGLPPNRPPNSVMTDLKLALPITSDLADEE